MTTYIVRRPRGLKLSTGVVPCGERVTSEQIGSGRAELAMRNCDWIREVKEPAASVSVRPGAVDAETQSATSFEGERRPTGARKGKQRSAKA